MALPPPKNITFAKSFSWISEVIELKIKNLTVWRVLILQAIRYTVVGIINVSVGLGVITGLMFFFGTPALPANFLGYFVGICVSYVLNKVWTFKNTATYRSSAAKFLFAVGICYCLNLFTLASIHGTALFNDYIAQIIAMGVYSSSLFIACRVFVFRY